MEQLLVQSLTFDNEKERVFANWVVESEEGRHDCVIEGSFKKDKNSKSSKAMKVKFTLRDESGDLKSFSGKMDANRSQIKGFWSYDLARPDQKRYFFELILEQKVKGTLNMTLTESGNKRNIVEEIEVDFKKKEISNAEGIGGNIDDFYAIEAVDQAELCYFILQEDV